jgi:hypothetical protein
MPMDTSDFAFPKLTKKSKKVSNLNKGTKKKERVKEEVIVFSKEVDSMIDLPRSSKNRRLNGLGMLWNLKSVTMFRMLCRHGSSRFFMQQRSLILVTRLALL